MKAFLLLILTALLGTALAGCLGGDGDDDDFDFVPGEGYTPTGKTVQIRMWVEDIVRKEVYPGLLANFWGFCAEPVDENDAYSAAAIEYWEEGQKCSVPGPTLRVQQGDMVEVFFENDHFHPHTIHWHGQHVPFESDGVPAVTQDSVQQQGSFKYEFEAKRAGTLWYHCHVDVQFHVMMGLYGMIIVEPQEKKWEPKDIDRDFVLVVSTARREHIEYIPPAPGEVFDPHAAHKHGFACGASGLQGCQNPQVNVKPDVFMVNGQSFPSTLDDPKQRLDLEPGERVRIRLLNAGETFETFHFHGHDLLVTHKDGNPLPPNGRYWTENIPIGPGERYDLVIEGSADAIGNWVMHTHVEDHVTNDGQGPGGMLTMITYPGLGDDLTPFKGELPGGQGFVRPREIPKDYRLDETQFIGASTGGGQNPAGVEATFTPIPVPEDMCLVDSVYFTAHMHGSTQAINSASLTLTVRNPKVDEVTMTFGPGSLSGSWYPDFNELATGNYTVVLTGSGTDLTFHVSTVIDYFPTQEIAEARGRPCAPFTTGA